MKKVNLDGLVELVDFQSYESEAWFNVKTGEGCLILNEALDFAESDNADYPVWMEDHVREAKSFLENPNDYITLPTQYDANEYGMMRDFALMLDDESVKLKLLKAIESKGAFRRFKDAVSFLGISDDWLAFRDKRYRQFVRGWCDKNRVPVSS